MNNAQAPRRALVVIDVQMEYFAGGGLPIEYPPVQDTLPNIVRAMDAAQGELKVEFLADASSALPYANAAGRASAEEIHRGFSVVFHSNFAAVGSTEAWVAALGEGRRLPIDNVLASNQRARAGHGRRLSATGVPVGACGNVRSFKFPGGSMPLPRRPAHRALVPLALAAALTGPAGWFTLAQAAPAPGVSSAVPAAQKRPYPGIVNVEVDATDLARKILRVRQTLPVKPGPLTLLYPRWLPGTHGPYGEASELAGLKVHAGERVLAWQRDTVDPYAFHLQVPAGVDTLALEFQYLSPTDKDGGRVVVTPQMLNVQWAAVVLYPAGYEVSGIPFSARLKLPPGWQAGTALRGQAQPDGWWQYEPVSLETLVDSPVFAGRHFRRVALDPAGAARPVVLNLVADTPQQLKASEAQLDAHRALVTQADKLFGARHFRHYDFLLSLSDTMGGIGLEHHESSENGVGPDYFKDWDKAAGPRDLLPHEYTHSWNGKFRRPADLWTPDYNTVPMRNSLLWLYEGQTQYWGRVLAARSGLVAPELARDGLAQAAAWAELRSGRAWRNLQDTTNEGTLGARGHHKAWRDWQRSVDYYDEATLIWLDADTLIREQSQGRRSLDDFARAFFGMEDGRVQPLTYTFDDIVKTLAAVWPHDWARFLRERLDTHERAPLDGLARSGWRLVYTEEQSENAKADEEHDKEADFRYSIGLSVSTEEDAAIKGVRWHSPAFEAGVAPGARLLAVNGVAYKRERLAEAITAAKDGGAPIELLLRDGEQFRSVRIDYRGGLRYPKLQRIDGTPDRLSAILAPR
jgi:predicted metalloprotease with PDZ domain